MNYDIDTPDGMANAVAWQKSLIRWIKDGGVWGVPRSESVYTLYKSKKIAVRTTGEESIDRVFNAMGWKVQEELL